MRPNRDTAGAQNWGGTPPPVAFVVLLPWVVCIRVIALCAIDLLRISFSWTWAVTGFHLMPCLLVACGRKGQPENEFFVVVFIRRRAFALWAHCLSLLLYSVGHGSEENAQHFSSRVKLFKRSSRRFRRELGVTKRQLFCQRRCFPTPGRVMISLDAHSLLSP